MLVRCLCTKINVPSGHQCSVRQISTGQMRTQRHRCCVRCQMTTYKLQATWCPLDICVLFGIISSFFSHVPQWICFRFIKLSCLNNIKCTGSITSFTKEHFILKKPHWDGWCLCAIMTILLLNPWSAKPRWKSLGDCRRGSERTLHGRNDCMQKLSSWCTFSKHHALFPLEQSTVYFQTVKHSELCSSSAQRSIKLTLFIQLM